MTSRSTFCAGGPFSTIGTTRPACFRSGAGFTKRDAGSISVVQTGANVYQGPYTDNDTRTAPADVTAYPAADLQVASVVTQAPNDSGEKTTVTWTVTNFGAPVWPGTRYWTDEVWFSPDPTFGSRAFVIGSRARSNDTPLGTNESYTVSQDVVLPRGIDGLFYIYVFTDRLAVTGRIRGVDRSPRRRTWPGPKSLVLRQRDRGHRNAVARSRSKAGRTIGSRQRQQALSVFGGAFQTPLCSAPICVRPRSRLHRVESPPCPTSSPAPARSSTTR